MAMKEKHYPVRLPEESYMRIKEWADSMGLSVQKCTEILIKRQLAELEKHDSLTIEISRPVNDGESPIINVKQ